MFFVVNNRLVDITTAFNEDESLKDTIDDEELQDKFFDIDDWVRTLFTMLL